MAGKAPADAKIRANIHAFIDGKPLPHTLASFNVRDIDAHYPGFKFLEPVQITQPALFIGSGHYDAAKKPGLVEFKATGYPGQTGNRFFLLRVDLDYKLLPAARGALDAANYYPAGWELPFTHVIPSPYPDRIAIFPDEAVSVLTEMWTGPNPGTWHQPSETALPAIPAQHRHHRARVLNEAHECMIHVIQGTTRLQGAGLITPEDGDAFSAAARDANHNLRMINPAHDAFWENQYDEFRDARRNRSADLYDGATLFLEHYSRQLDLLRRKRS
jgi:hypothetical protein